MSIFLEITELENGDIVLREAQDPDHAAERTPDQLQDKKGHDQLEQDDSPDPLTVSSPAREPLVRIRFSNEVKDMLGDELVGVAEAMIDAATEFLGSDTIEIEADRAPPVVH